MGCVGGDVLTGISYNCDDIPIGGLKEVWVAHKANIVSYTPTDGTDVTGIIFKLVTNCVRLEFNNKDGFSSMTNVKTATADNIVTTVPTVVLEFPKMTSVKKVELEALVNANNELVVFVRDAADNYHMLGYEYGMYGSEANGQTGTGRSSKNVYQLTLIGEEDSLGLSMTSAGWADVIASATS